MNFKKIFTFVVIILIVLWLVGSTLSFGLR